MKLSIKRNAHSKHKDGLLNNPDIADCDERVFDFTDDVSVCEGLLVHEQYKQGT